MWWGVNRGHRLQEDGSAQSSAQLEVIRMQIITDKTPDQRQWRVVWGKIVDDCSTEIM